VRFSRDHGPHSGLYTKTPAFAERTRTWQGSGFEGGFDEAAEGGGGVVVDAGTAAVGVEAELADRFAERGRELGEVVDRAAHDLHAAWAYGAVLDRDSYPE